LTSLECDLYKMDFFDNILQEVREMENAFLQIYTQ
jgi:hypothetical protein